MKHYIFVRILFTKRLCVMLSFLPIVAKRKGTNKVSQRSLKSLVIIFVLVDFWSFKLQCFGAFEKEDIASQEKNLFLKTSHNITLENNNFC